ncbi:hypothetical protein J3U99_10930 [Brucella pituitosa]|uniref:hypothetical protein n=1 Tax=Brucella pituitosa TaxID=571256 RepID=UPI00200310C3|nr:hypothetical protein [Brucella pituitosa]MCK4205281.1 hypothetical protein [Brucella pituitosa]
MSDKEKVEKENEQFSSSILYVATAVYVGVCAMVFGALYARQQSFGDAFLKLMADYGTILAGIPVLIAVVVAKQQLDANRRQHVATVKRSLREEIDSLNEVKFFASHYTGYEVEMASRYFPGAIANQSFVGHSYLSPGLPRPNSVVWNSVKASNSIEVTQAAFELFLTLNEGKPFNFMSDESIQYPLDVDRIWDQGRIVFAANRVLETVSVRQKYLEQYY